MKRICAVIALLVLSGFAQAQSQPVQARLDMALSADEVMPGTPVKLSISVVVPTWMPEPAAFPDFELPHLMVRQPPDSVRSTRRRVDGQMWVGVAREYLLYPMLPGEYVIPPRPLLVTYADADTRAPVNVTIMTDTVRLFGVVPPAAEGLDPFVAAEALELTETLEGWQPDMTVGGAFRREVTATIRGTSPLFLPPLLPDWAAPGVAAYPTEPILADESSGEGAVGGTRVESISYAVERGGRFTLPAVELRWFNLSTGMIETARLPSHAFAADYTLAQQFERHWRSVAAAAVSLGLLAWLFTRLFPALLARLRQRYAAALHRYQQSAAYSARQAIKSIRYKDLDATLKHIDTWLQRLAPGAVPDTHELQGALAQVGSARYGRGKTANSADWGAVERAFRAARTRSQEQRKLMGQGGTLPPLNPLGKSRHVSGQRL